MYNFKQVVLEKQFFRTISWIPEKFAFIGKSLKLKMGNNWDDGWIVVSVSSFTKTEDQINKISRSYKNMREVSDI